jgi:ABC-2 type transport system permease protein
VTPPPSTGSARKFLVLLWIQLTRLRTSWRPYLVVSSLMPLGIALLLRAVMDDSQIREFGEEIVAGCAVLAIAMTAIVMLAQRMAWLKEHGVLELYSTLPVSRTSVIAAVLASFAVFSLPGTVVVVVAGAAMFGLAFAAVWPAILVWVFASFALAGIGVAIGLAAPDEQLAGMYSNLAMMAVLFLGIVPHERLPGWLIPLRTVLPSTYAVDALRPGLAGTSSVSIAPRLVVLAVIGTLSFWAVRGPLWPRAE